MMDIDAATLTKTLRGKWHGLYGLAYCPAHRNTRTPALSLANGKSGRLLAYCHAGCDFLAIMDSLRELGLLNNDLIRTAPIEAGLPRRRSRRKSQTKNQPARANLIWSKARPTKGTQAETYLRARGITCQLPDTLRFSPSCWHNTGSHHPAMVGLVEGGHSFAVHRTYLQADGSGKAQVQSAKMMLGPCAGGAVRLSQTDGTLLICEGIETGLSLLSGLLQGPSTVWAALSTSGVKSLRLPPQTGLLTVAADGDAPGREAAYALASRADSLGWVVSLLPAPEGRDWNDVLQGGAA
jgi:hypothetical protein